MSKTEIECLNFIKKNANNTKIYFGINFEEFEFIKQVLSGVTKTKGTVFPDFVFEKGFIEHFRVTSSSESKREKGSEHLKSIAEYNKKKDKDFKNFMNDDSSQELTKIHQYCAHSYKNFCISFDRQIRNKIKKMNQYTGSKENVIFMIDYSDFALRMKEDKCRDIEGILIGDYGCGVIEDDYRLSRDKKMLLNIYNKFKDEIHYIIFKNRTLAEIIKVDSIPILVTFLPFEYIVIANGNTIVRDYFRKVSVSYE